MDQRCSPVRIWRHDSVYALKHQDRFKDSHLLIFHPCCDSWGSSLVGVDEMCITSVLRTWTDMRGHIGRLQSHVFYNDNKAFTRLLCRTVSTFCLGILRSSVTVKDSFQRYSATSHIFLFSIWRHRFYSSALHRDQISGGKVTKCIYWTYLYLSISI